jgi:hypothetical protein
MENKIRLYSPTIKKEITFETNDIYGPKHSSIENYFYSEMTNCKLKRTFLKMELDHSVVEICISSDNPQRCITAIGEATAMSLTTDIAKANPVITADNRAFDRAVLKYLGLNNVYAASENVQQDKLKSYIESTPVNISEPESDPADSESEINIKSFDDVFGESDVVAGINEDEEFAALSKEKCNLKLYKDASGKQGYPAHGWILKHHPKDIVHMIDIARKMDPEHIKFTDPEKAEALIKFNRFVELGKKLGHIN